jgi:hypothetical protein
VCTDTSAGLLWAAVPHHPASNLPPTPNLTHYSMNKTISFEVSMAA